MDIMELGAIGELVGGIAVVASLLYVGLQVRQGNRAARSTVFDQTAHSWSDILRFIIDDPDFFLRGAMRYDELSEPETLRFISLLAVMFAHFENFFLKRQDGFFVSDEEWKRVNRVMVGYLRFPGVRQGFWPAWGQTVFTSSFVQHVDQVLVEIRDLPATEVDPNR